MPISTRIRSNRYKDSVALMRIAQALLAMPGVRAATLMMGTPANKAILAQAGLDGDEARTAQASDLMIVVDGVDAPSIEAAQAHATALLDGGGDRPAATAAGDAARPRSLSSALDTVAPREIRLAQVSVPGPYAAAEALKALRRGLDVFLFSDNVPLEQECALKAIARDKGLLVMGPDCGTAIVHGTPVGFANVVRQGAIGLVGASGTGLQEVTCLIHALGEGVRHAIGTGGRDVSAEVGGGTMLQAIDLLAADAGTEVIVIVSKPPAPEVARRILERARGVDKPLVVLFLGAQLAREALPANVTAVDTLHAAASRAVAARARGTCAAPSAAASPALEAAGLRTARSEAQRLAPGQRGIRALYAGGTFCTEAQLVWRARGLAVHSNVPVDAAAARNAAGAAHRHVALDLGADEFTVGRPHPMIDPAPRAARLLEEARDPATAVIVIDVVLGYAAHADPAGALVPAIVQARDASARAGRHLTVVAFVCGTEEDPQRLSLQQAKLRDAGALVVASSTAAAEFAGELAVAAAQDDDRVRAGAATAS